jgi:hypothetical protein
MTIRSSSEIGLSAVDLVDLELIDPNGAGRVFRGRSAGDGELVAVKVFVGLGSDSTSTSRLQSAIDRTEVVMDDPAVVSVLSHGMTADGFAYIVMQHMAGGSLADRLAAGETFTPEDSIDIAHTMTSAIARAHGQGIEHGDLYPSRILFDEAGRAHLSGFGQHALRAGKATRTDTISSQISTMVPYAAPEVIGGGAVSTATDIYAMGATLYALAAGRPPFIDSQADTWLAVIGRVAGGHLTPIDGAPDALMRIVEKAMAKEPSDRFDSAEEMANALEALRPGTSHPMVAPDTTSIVRSHVAGVPTELATDRSPAPHTAETEMGVTGTGTVAEALTEQRSSDLEGGEGAVERDTRRRRWMGIAALVTVMLGVGAALASSGGEPDATVAAETTVTSAPTTTPSTASAQLQTVEALEMAASAVSGRTLRIDVSESLDGRVPESIEITIRPTFGAATVDLDAATIIYQPDPGYPSSTDLLGYLVCAGDGDCRDVTVRLAIAPPGSAPPKALDDEATATVGEPAVIEVLANDLTGAEPDPDTLSIIGSPRTGAATVDNDSGTISYTAESVDDGLDQIVYRVCAVSDRTACAQATVDIVVTASATSTTSQPTAATPPPPAPSPATTTTAAPTTTTTAAAPTVTSPPPTSVNLPPDAKSDNFSLSLEPGESTCLPSLTANDNARDGDTLSVVDFSQPSDGSVAFGGCGSTSLLFTAGTSSSTSFTYVVSDGIETDSATVFISLG